MKQPLHNLLRDPASVLRRAQLLNPLLDRSGRYNVMVWPVRQPTIAKVPWRFTKSYASPFSRSLIRSPQLYKILMKAMLQFSLASVLAFSVSVCLAAVPTQQYADEKIPNTPLTPDILFNVLAAEMALQKGSMGVAWDGNMKLAKTTRDPRFAQRALEIALASQQIDQALTSAKLWHDISPRSEIASQSLQMLLILQNRLPEFERLAKKELANVPEDKRVTLLLGIYERLSRGPDKMAIVPVFEALLKMDKLRPETQLALARAYIRAGQTDAAQRALNITLKLKPNFALAILMLADMQRQAGQADLAQALLQDFVQVEQKSQVLSMQRMVQIAYQMLAQIAEDAKDFVGANDWLAKVSLADLNFSAQAQRARILLKESKFDAAKQVFAQLEQQPGLTAEQQRELLKIEVGGWIEVQAYDQALAQLQKQLKVWPKDADLWCEIALVQEKLAQYDAMEQSLRTAIKYNPKMAQAYNVLGYSMVERNQRLSEARFLIDKALNLIPDDPDFLDSMGWLAYRQGNFQEAKNWLERAFLLKSDVAIGVHLAEVLWHLGEQNEARELLRNMQALDANNEMLKQTLQRLLKPGESL